MQIDRKEDRLTLTLQGEEVSLLADSLRRATFEDTPPERQRRILDFASELLRRMEEG